jgi:thiosulfate reductase cytochrome b subunit
MELRPGTAAAGDLGAAFMTSTTADETGQAAPRREVVYRHSGVVRLTHWINALALLVLLMSGMQIFNAHPSLTFAKVTSFTHPWLSMDAVNTPNGGSEGVTTVFGHRFDTTGFLGGGPSDQGFQSYGFNWAVTLPGYRYLALGRRWHFFFAWVFVINGLLYLAYAITSGHVRRDLAPSQSQLSHIGRSIRDHLLFRFDHGDEARHYNVLQKLAYLGVIFVLLPLMLATGLAMSPAMGAAFPWLLEIFNGRPGARTIHFICANLIVLFFAVHIFMVLVSGLWNNIRSMITGRYVIVTEEPKP